FRKLLALWFNGFTAFSTKPLRIATVSGSLFALAGFGYGIYTILKKFLVPEVPIGFSSLMSALMFIGGMVLLMMGLIGEYIGRIYICINNAPQFVVREMVEGNKFQEDKDKE
ncbi:MAG: glycosyltransferase, partial [Lachnospiraceae bacterium]|nr:glycosyltransferase [Lachnospiraceae bacterium]